MNYDMDGKNPFHADPPNRDGERAIWTMAYVASGTLMLSPSFGRMTAEQVHDLSRIYPFHAARQSARPLDLFTSQYPRVYDYRVDAALAPIDVLQHRREAGSEGRGRPFRRHRVRRDGPRPRGATTTSTTSGTTASSARCPAANGSSRRCGRARRG